MSCLFYVLVVTGLIFGSSSAVFASYRGSDGTVKSGTPGTYQSASKSAEVMAVEEYIDSRERGGYFMLQDPKTGKTRKLTLTGLSSSAKKIGANQGVVYVKFRDKDTGETVETDFTLRMGYGQPRVLNVVIYAVNGKRY